MSVSVSEPSVSDPSATPAPMVMEPQTTPPARRSHLKIPALDGIRAVAIILVLVAHAGLDKLVPGGLGVTIFFFLSGYLITTLMRNELANTGRLDIKKFYIRRALRIFPPLYITLIAVWIAFALGACPLEVITVTPLKFGAPIQLHLDAIALQFVHLANYIAAMGKTGELPNMPLWSLAVEEHFYLFFPLIFILMARRWSGKTQAILLLVGCAITLGVRVVTAKTLADYHQIYNWSHTRIDSILFGCVLAVWSNPVMDDDEKSYRPSAAHFIGAIAVLLGCLIFRNEFFRQTLRYSIQGLALFVIFSFIIRMKSGLIYDVLASKAMKTIGLLSYTVYLINYFIFMAMAERFPHTPGLVRNSIALVITFIYAGLMYRLVEKPLGRMRSRMH